MQEENVIQFYSSFAKNYDRCVFQDRDYIAYTIIPEWIVQFFHHHPSQTDDRTEILDLGCGTGLSSLSFFKAGYKVTGIDITQEMLDVAKQHPFWKLICQSLETRLPFPNQSFDAAVMLGVMEFIQDPAALFQEVKRVLKKGKLFGLTIPLKLSSVQEKKLGITSFETKKIEALFLESGFKILHSESFQGFISDGEAVSYKGYLLLADGDDCSPIQPPIA